MKALVTGGGGFIGHNLVKKLLDRGDAVTVIDNFSTGRRENVDARAELVEGDIRDRTLLKTVFQKGFDVVFHTAALARIQPSIEDPLTTHDVNVTGTLNLLRAAAESGVKRFVYSSSSSVYGKQESLPFHEGMTTDPQNPYAMQKWMGEELCRLFSSVYGLDTVCLRYFNVYGPGMIDEGAYRTVISIFLGQSLEGKPLTIVGDGLQRRDFTHVSDIVRGNILAAECERPLGGVPVNLGRGESVAVRTVAETVLAKAGRQWDEATTVLPPRAFEAQETLAGNKRADALLGWKPEVAFAQGLNDLLY